MELTKEKTELITKTIRADKKFSSNEDLFDDFYSEAYKRSLLIMRSVNNPSSLEVYLKKVVSTAISVVLKDFGRIRRNGNVFIPTNVLSLDQITKPKPSASNKYSNVKITYDFPDYRDNPEEIIIKRDVLDTVYESVIKANDRYPSKKYLELYKLRYIKEMKQVQIAREMKLSQSEVSKRLLDLMEHVKRSFSS